MHETTEKIATKSLAEELLTEVVLNQLQGCLADEDCIQYKQIDSQRPKGKASVIVNWQNSDSDEGVFALVIFSEKVLAEVQSAVDAENENLYEDMFDHIEDWTVFRATHQDSGGPIIWETPDDVFTPPFYYLRTNV
ncbi:MAG: hypothetical protein EOO52_13140 [Gammaproteobacteria bacterium]|nr:MAG: hypothetical protein EOO52_13140 [Gammaproteobacteria bacterium]